MRTLVRLHETCRELRCAAGLLGDAALHCSRRSRRRSR